MYLEIGKITWESSRFKTKTLTVSACGPVWITELVIRKAGESVIVLLIILCESVVMFTSIAFVKDCFIMGWRILWIPIKQKIAFSWRIRRVGTMRP